MGGRGRGMHWSSICLWGIPLYVVLYVLATRYYPGGSHVDPHSVGFSWTNNYWCDLLDRTAVNGLRNPAQPMAVTAMGVLCISLIVFFWGIPASLSAGERWRNIIRLCGTGAMICGALMGTFDHDLMTNIASLLGLIAVAGILHLLRGVPSFGLFWAGLAILLLVALNNLFYYTGSLRVYLPVVQKITFLYVLAWIWVLCLRTRVAGRSVGTGASGRS